MIDETKPVFVLRDGIVSSSFIAAADLHLGLKLYGNPELEEDMKDNFIRLCDLAISKKVKYLILAGDLFEDNYPKPDEIALIDRQSKRLAEAGIKLVGIAGDHDKPINGETWCKVSGVQPVYRCPGFAGLDYYDYSWDTMDMLMYKLQESCHPTAKEDILWIILHAQFPMLYHFAEAKKIVDFSKVELFNLFPNLQGVIAGDIHTPLDGKLIEKDREAYIGYCGSLGINDISESQQEKGVYYCDGHKLYRLPFYQRRDFVRINFKGENHKVFDASAFQKQYKDVPFRPVFLIEYDLDSESYLSAIKPLYSLGIVRTSTVPRDLQTGKEEAINIRSELKTEDKIDSALRVCCGDDREVYTLLSESLTAADPKVIFDAFKTKAFS